MKEVEIHLLKRRPNGFLHGRSDGQAQTDDSSEIEAMKFMTDEQVLIFARIEDRRHFHRFRPTSRSPGRSVKVDRRRKAAGRGRYPGRDLQRSGYLARYSPPFRCTFCCSYCSLFV